MLFYRYWRDFLFADGMDRSEKKLLRFRKRIVYA